MRHEVDRLGRVAREDRRLRRGAHERGDALARAFEELRRALGERVGAAVDRRVALRGSNESIASITTRGFWPVAALSR